MDTRKIIPTTISVVFVLIALQGFNAFGPVGWAIWAASFLLVVFGLVAFVVEGNLSRLSDISIADPKLVTGDLAVLVGQLEALGFRQLPNVLVLQTQDPALLVCLVHKPSQTMANAFWVAGGDGHLGWDFVSRLRIPAEVSDGLSFLTTTAFGGGFVDPRPGCFSQRFRGASPEEAFRSHVDALRYLELQQLPMTPILPSEYQELFESLMRADAAAFRKNRIRNTLKFLFRHAFRTSTTNGPLSEQALARKEIRRIEAHRARIPYRTEAN